MVGISMLVNLRVHSESIIRGWELPTRMPPGFLYFFDMLDREQVRRVIALPEIRDPMPVTTFWVRYQDAERTDDESSVATFIAGPFQQFSALVQLSFSELPPGRDADWAVAQVDAARSVIVTREFATRHDVRIGDSVRLWRHDRGLARDFTVVGIVESSTLDMAIDFLNLRDRYQNLASGTIIGSVAEANDILRGEQPATDADDGLPPDPSLPMLTRLLLFEFADGPSDRMAPGSPPAEQIRRGEQANLERIKGRLKPMKIEFFAGSLDELREMIIGEFRAVVRILQKLALWAMAIASLGVGFSMAANVHSRRRQLAVLRAIGVTRLQLARLVLAEAVTIALLGSLLGIVHGIHLAANATYFDRVLFGLQPRWTLQPGVLGLAIGFAVACCLIASVVPAMRAGRTNIIAAMRQL